MFTETVESIEQYFGGRQGFVRCMGLADSTARARTAAWRSSGFCIAHACAVEVLSKGHYRAANLHPTLASLRRTDASPLAVDTRSIDGREDAVRQLVDVFGTAATLAEVLERKPSAARTMCHLLRKDGFSVKQAMTLQVMTGGAVRAVELCEDTGRLIKLAEHYCAIRELISIAA